MAITYFGCNEDMGSAGYSWADMLGWFAPDVFTSCVCPGTGPQRIKALELEMYPASSTGNIKVMVYTAAGALVCTATKYVDGSGGTAWWGITDETQIDPPNTNLVGGQQYVLAFMTDQNGFLIKTYNTAYTYNSKYTSQSYAGGPPATLPGSGTNFDAKWSIRCGVEDAPAGAGASVRSLFAFWLGGVGTLVSRLLGPFPLFRPDLPNE